MIRGVNNNPYQNRYDSGMRTTGKADEKAPAFLLNYDETGVVWERNKKETEKKIPSQTSSSQAPLKNDKGVVYESTFDKNSRVNTTEPKNGEQTFAVSDFFRKIGDFFRKIADFFWFGEEEKQAEENPGAVDVKNALQKEEVQSELSEERQMATAKNLTPEEKDEKIRELLRKKDTAGVMDVLTENHKLRLARNSTLLTYYDKRGKIVTVTGSDKERILHGDGIEKRFREKI